MKKLLVLGLSACLLFSFTGSALAASQTSTHAKKQVIHAAVSKKHTVPTVTAAKKKASHTAVSSKKTITHGKKHAVSKKAKKTVHNKTSVSQPNKA